MPFKGNLLKVGCRPHGCSSPSPERILVPKPFVALPPRGRRHIVVQLEIKEALNKNSSQEDVVPKYLLSFYGGIFHFRQKFDDQDVPCSYLQTGASEHQCEYVRFIEFGDSPAGKQQVKDILESILDNMPVYFVDLTACEDPVAAWLAGQGSVIPSANKENIEWRCCVEALAWVFKKRAHKNGLCMYYWTELHMRSACLGEGTIFWIHEPCHTEHDSGMLTLRHAPVLSAIICMETILNQPHLLVLGGNAEEELDWASGCWLQRQPPAAPALRIHPGH